MRLWAILAVLITAAPQVVIPRVPPVITSVSPTSGAVADSITITGSSFGVRQENSVLSFNGIPASPSAWADTSITTPVPVGATSGSVTIRRGGQTSNGLAFTVSSSSCSPSPCISGVSGTVTNASAITVTGAGFGATGPTVVLFDDFEGGTAGSQINMAGATAGSWRQSAPPVNRPVYSTAQAVSGTKSAFVDTTGPNTDNGLPVALSTVTDVYYSWNVKLPTGDVVIGNGQVGNWKVLWLYQTGTGDNDVTLAMAGNNQPIDNWKLFGNNQPMEDDNSSNFTSCQSHYPPCVSSDFLLANGSWYRMQEYHHASAVDGSAQNQFAYSNKDIPTAWANHYNSTHANVFAGTFTGWLELVVNGFNRQTLSGTSRIYYDDVYVATSTTSGCARARVEIGNAATYAGSSKLTPVTTTAWADGSISGVVRQGPFTAGGAFLYITKCDGSLIGPQAVTVS